MKREELIAALSDFLKETLRLKNTHIDPQDNLMEKFGLDSMGAVEYVIKLEEEFDIAISDEEVQTVYTLNRAADLVLEKLRIKQSRLRENWGVV